MRVKFGSKEKFAVIPAILIITDLVNLLDNPFLRQIFGFIFITILPGLLILQILKSNDFKYINKIRITEKFVLSTWENYNDQTYHI